MEELSVEEKARRYDEAIKRFEDIKTGKCKKTFTFTNDFFEYLFPALKESEDEKIRKELMKNLKERFGTRGSMGGNLDMPRVLAWLEKQGEKPANNVETKFKVGDWLVQNERKNIVKVVNATSLVYKVVDFLGYHHTITNTAIENNYHLWIIQDAKDGDVLACESGWTCIFKSLNDDNTFCSYCFMDKTKWFCETGSKYHTHSKEFMKAYNGEIGPATKEQRDTLEKAMADAGYTFDFKKKELKKIEQKKTPIKGEFPYDNPSDTLDGEIENIWGKLSSGDRFSATKEGFREVITHFVNYIKEQDDLELVEYKSAEWCEEDEQYLLVCKNALSKYQTTDKWDADIIYNWLEGKIKFLKDRVQPRNTWKPSDEQIEALDDFIYAKYPNIEKYGAAVKSLYQDLKKLKE